MEKGEKINIETVGERNFNASETIKQMQCIGDNAMIKLMSWGAHKFVVDKKDQYGESQALRFKVNGLKHKGFVYIVLAYNDTYTIYYVNNSGKIIEKQTDIYFDVLNETIDNYVEKVDEYEI